MTLDQIKAAAPTYEYDPLYGAQSGPWTTGMFIEAALQQPRSQEVTCTRETLS